MKKIYLFILFAIMGSISYFLSCNMGNNNYSSKAYSFPGVIAVFENGKETEVFDTFERIISSTPPTIHQFYSVNTAEHEYSFYWQNSYLDSNFTEKIESFTNFMTIEEAAERSKNGNTEKLFGNVIQEGYKEAIKIYVKNSDIESMEAKRITLALYNNNDEKIGLKTLKSDSELEQNELNIEISGFTDDNKHYYSSLFFDKNMTNEVIATVNIKDLFINNFKLYSIGAECSDASFFEISGEYSNTLILSKNISETEKKLIIPPLKIFSDSVKEISITDSNFEEIVIPNDCTILGDFNNNSKLEKITNLENIEKARSFKGCSKLKEIVLKNIDFLPSFDKCDSLANITLKNIKKIEFGLVDCKSLKTIIYEGTKEDWNNNVKLNFYKANKDGLSGLVSETTKWVTNNSNDRVTYINSSIPSGITIKCTDGDIVIEAYRQYEKI